MSLQWYVGVAKLGQEMLAKRELENQHFEVYLPLCISGTGRSERIRPFLAPYIFVRIDLDDSARRWHAVYSTRGVRKVISVGDRPQPVANWIIEEIMAREVAGLVKLSPKEKCQYVGGEAVRMKNSPLDAVFGEPVDDKRARIFVTFLGRPHKLIVPISKLSRQVTGGVR